MSTRKYAFLLLSTAALLFAGLIGTNLALDPQNIYWRGTASGLSASTNDRYLQFSDYEAAPDSHGGLLFGSSRGRGIPLDELSRDSGGVKFANFAVYGGMITDHLPLLEFVLRDQEGRGSRLRAVFLLLDIDVFGERPLTNRVLQYTWPPAVTGESPLRFWWRNLIAIQFEAWQNALADFLPGRLPREATERRDRDSGRAATAPGLGAIVAAASAQPADPNPAALPLKRIRERRFFYEHLAMLQAFVELCREHDVTLTIAVSPLRVENAALFDAADLAQAIADVSAIAPAWDFGSAQWLSDRPELWFDQSHFTTWLGHMMLDRIFLAKPPEGHQDFGVLRRN